MLVLDIIGQEINIGDDVVLWDGYGVHKVKLVKETKLSVGYFVYDYNTSKLQENYIYWTRKSAIPFRNMYKI